MLSPQVRFAAPSMLKMRLCYTLTPLIRFRTGALAAVKKTTTVVNAAKASEGVS